MPSPIVIVSADKEVIELAEGLNREVLGFFDVNSKASAFSKKNLGDDTHWSEFKKRHPKVEAIISIDLPEKKKKILEIYGSENLTSLISKEAYISPSAKIDKGCVIQQGVRIFSDVFIGKVCKINVNAIIHHDCRVGNFCTLAPGSHLLGKVHVEDDVFIGAGAIILPYVKICKGAYVGAGAVVTKNVEPGKTVKGVPAKG